MAKKQKTNRKASSAKSASASSAAASSPMVKPWEHAKADHGSQTDELAMRFVESLSYDRRLYRYDIAGSIAHAKMLQQVGLLSHAELATIEQGLRKIESQITQQGDAWSGWKIELEDVHMCIEAALIQNIGDPGRKLHTGRSRNDQVALDLKLWLAESRQTLVDEITALLQAFLDLAQRDGQIVMPSYTHLQRAQPMIVAGELLAWMNALDRAIDRLTALAVINHDNPLGAGAIAGSSLPLDRAVSAAMLHVGPPGGSSLDATASRDAAIDFVYGLAMLAMTLSRWAEQWIIYTTTEFGFIRLDDRYTTGSSMMPQKRNPDMLELIRGRCGNLYGHLTALLTICKGLPMGYNRDLQEDKRQVFAAYDMAMDCVAMATRIVRTTRFNASRIQQDLEAGFLDATSLAEYLVNQGVPFRTAHQIVGALVRTCEAGGYYKLAQLTIADFQAACQASGQKIKVTNQVYDWLGPANVVKQYQTYGNAGVTGTAAQLKQWKQRLT